MFRTATIITVVCGIVPALHGAANAQVNGLKDPKKVLAEFRAEIAKVK